MKNIFNKLAAKAAPFVFQAKKHAPIALITFGIGATTVGAYKLAKAVDKTEVIFDNHRAIRRDMDGRYDTNDEYNDLEYRSDRVSTLVHTGSSLAKTLAPSVGILSLGVVSTLAGYKVIRGRLVATTATLATVSTRFADYRSRVVEDVGIDKDMEYLTNTRIEKVKEKYVDEEGKTRTKTVEVLKEGTGEYSPYSYIWSEDTSLQYQNNSNQFYNITFLKRAQDWANDHLRLRGHLFLNEVLDYLGLDRTFEGVTAGWLWDPSLSTGDQFVDFGIFDLSTGELMPKTKQMALFMNGQAEAVWLDFNVEGSIHERFQLSMSSKLSGKRKLSGGSN